VYATVSISLCMLSFLVFSDHTNIISVLLFFNIHSPLHRRLLLESEDVGTVFATDAILSTLMCAPRSVYSWDIVAQRVGNKLFFDKRDSSFDLLTVSILFTHWHLKR
jgi:hypothetical protein